MARKPLSQAHKDKIAAGMRAYHRGCRKKPKKKAVPKKKTPLPKEDQGRRLRQAVDKVERRERMKRDMMLSRRIRGVGFV